MSRSYKHTPYCGMEKSKFFKKFANRKLRRNKLKNNFQYGAYKKNFDSWNICDYYHIASKNFENYYKEVVANWYRWRYYLHEDPFPNKKTVKKEYVKYYLRK